MENVRKAAITCLKSTAISFFFFSLKFLINIYLLYIQTHKKKRRSIYILLVIWLHIAKIRESKLGNATPTEREREREWVLKNGFNLTAKTQLHIASADAFKPSFLKKNKNLFIHLEFLHVTTNKRFGCVHWSPQFLQFLILQN